MSDKIEDFISTVSHELRTPLTSIRGFSQTILSSWDKLDDESKKRFIKIIEEQSNRLINLVENMLTVTKNHELILKDVVVKPVVQTVVSLIKTQYPAHTYEINISDRIPSMLADKDKFQQIMTNLIENAAKYSDENSVITVNAETEQEFVAVKVVNTGIGIEEGDFERIFEKFSRADNPLTRKTEGSGLGLYITKNLTEKMGGTISVQSKDSTVVFTVKLPVSNIEARLKCSQ